MPGLLWSRIKNYLYDKELLRVAVTRSFVLSIGNITWGGTGKTSLTVLIARHLLSRRYRVAIVSRGYRRKSRGLRLVSDGKTLLEGDWKQAGEESFWIARSLPQAIVVVSESRRRALKFLEQLKPDVILLDDAFQHRKVFRNLDIVLLDSSENILKQKVIPFGKMREPVDSLKRADAIILTHTKTPNGRTLKWVEENLQIPVFHANYEAADFRSYAGKKVAAFCGIAAPRHFFRLIEESGALLFWKRKFPDHHNYSREDLRAIETEAIVSGAELILTTEKDAVKVNSFPFRLPLVIVQTRFRITEEQQFFDLLEDRLTTRNLFRR